MLLLTSLHLSHESLTVCHSFTQRYNVCLVFLGSSHCSCCKWSLTAPICLTGFLHTFSGFLSSSNTTHYLHQPRSQKSCPHPASLPANVLSWLVFGGVSHASTASLHPVAQLQHSLHDLPPPLLPLCNGVWKKGWLQVSPDIRVYGDIGIFPRCSLHIVDHEARWHLPAACIKSKGRLWAKPGWRPAAGSGAACNSEPSKYCSSRCIRNANCIPFLEYWVSAALSRLSSAGQITTSWFQTLATVWTVLISTCNVVRQKYYSVTLQRTPKGSFCYLLKLKTCLYAQDTYNTIQPKTYYDPIYIIFLLFSFC